MTAPSTSSLTISSGELFGSLNIEIIDDTVKEQNETFLIAVHIQDSCLPLIIDGNDTFTITIIDNEGIVIWILIRDLLIVIFTELMVEFSQAIFSGLESSGGIAVMLNLLGGTASYTFNVTITLSSSSATGKRLFANIISCITYVVTKLFTFMIRILTMLLYHATLYQFRQFIFITFRWYRLR